VSTDLRGIESHGVSNMLSRYVQQYEDGVLDPCASLTTDQETASTASLHGNRGLGIIQGPQAMQLAIEKARHQGLGMVTLSNSGHLGAIGHHALLATHHDMLGMCFSANRPLMLPPGGAEPLIGSNPLAIAAPTTNLPPVVFDIATTATAINKIKTYCRQQQPIPPGMIADEQGNPAMKAQIRSDPHVSLLPLGSTPALGSHKGFGLAFFPELLATFLSGSLPFLLDPEHLNSHCFCAINIACFTEVSTFKTHLETYLQRILDAATLPHMEHVLYPGYPEYLAERDRECHGIPLHEEVLQWFEAFSNNAPVPVLEICDVAHVP
jgi:LDH2 family malate/lactate/ureidoglycolate dehydrogenase